PLGRRQARETVSVLRALCGNEPFGSRAPLPATLRELAGTRARRQGSARGEMKRTTLWDLGLPLHQPLIVGHRGACGYAPENTLPSLELAVAQSVDMIEFDVHLTRDGELLAS